MTPFEIATVICLALTALGSIGFFLGAFLPTWLEMIFFGLVFIGIGMLTVLGVMRGIGLA